MGTAATGSVVIVLVSGYQTGSGAVQHGVLAFDRDGREVRVYDPATIEDDQGMTPATKAYAASVAAFARMIRSDRDRAGAALIRKGLSR